MTKPFCYLSATLGLDAEPADLKAGESWTLRYGVAVLAGNVDRARLSKLAADWRTSAGASQPNQQPPTKP